MKTEHILLAIAGIYIFYNIVSKSNDEMANTSKGNNRQVPVSVVDTVQETVTPDYGLFSDNILQAVNELQPLTNDSRANNDIRRSNKNFLRRIISRRIQNESSDARNSLRQYEADTKQSTAEQQSDILAKEQLALAFINELKKEFA